MNTPSSTRPTAQYMATYARRLRAQAHKGFILTAVMAGVLLVCTIIAVVVSGTQSSPGFFPYPLLYMLCWVACLGSLAHAHSTVRRRERDLERYEAEARREEETSA